MGTHPIFESDFDCLTELTNHVKPTDPTDPGLQATLVGRVHARDQAATDATPRQHVGRWQKDSWQGEDQY